MTTTPPDTSTHPVERALEEIAGLIDRMAEIPSWSMSATERTRVTVLTARLRNKLAGFFLGTVCDADRNDDATALGATNTAGLVRSLIPLSGPEARRTVRLARAVDAHPLAAAALSAGDLCIEQAAVVTDAVDALPLEDRHAAEAHLVGLAVEHDAASLKVLGKHVLEVVAPERADAVLGAQLEAEEARSARTTYLELHDDGHGRCSGRFSIPSLHGQMLRTYLGSLMNSARPDPISADSRAEARGQAFCQLLERYPVRRLPNTGGVSATVVVTMTHESLLGGLCSAGILGTDLRISAPEARRLACEAGVIPAVLGGKSEVLDLGRKRRLFSKSQRLALALEQGGICAIDRCDRPASWADADHVTPYSEGGSTNLANGRLLCPRHHTLAHDPKLELLRLPNGRHRFHRRE